MVLKKTLYKHYTKKLSKIKNDETNNDYKNNTIVYVSDKKILVFIAGLHLGGERKSSAKLFITFIKSISKNVKPKMVLLELPRNLPKSVMTEWLQKPKKYWLESEWLVYYGKKYGNAKYLCMDITSKEWTNATLNFEGSNNNFKLVLFSNFLMKFIWAANYWYVNNNGIANKQDVFEFAKYKTIDAIINGSDNLSYIKKDIIKLHMRYKNKNFNDTIEGVLREMADKYVVKGIKLNSLININKPRLYLFPFSKYRINKVLIHEDTIRDTCMLTNALNAFTNYDRVVAMAGSSHINRFNDVLDMELKKRFKNTKIMTWNEFIKIKDSKK